MAKHSHRAVKTLVHCMPGLPASFYFHFSPSLNHGKKIRGTVLETYSTMGGRRPTDRPCLDQIPPEADFLPPSCSLSSYQNEKTYSGFILQQKRVTQSPNIHICPNIPAPHQVSFVKTVSDIVSQTDPLTCRTAQSVSCLKTLIYATPSQHSSGPLWFLLQILT